MLDKYEDANTAFRTGSVITDDKEKLLEYLSGLSNQSNTNDGVKHRDIIRGITINHLLLQKYIDSLERKSATMQKWVIALAVASLLGTGIQILVDLLKKQFG